MNDTDRELRRIEERIDVVANWLIQGRCGDDDECAAARRLEIEQLQRRRAALRAELDAGRPAEAGR